MSDQPKPTGEWTEWTGKRIQNFLTQRSAKELADEINASITAELEKVKGLHEACRAESNHSSKLREQLAAAQAALAKVKVGK